MAWWRHGGKEHTFVITKMYFSPKIILWPKKWPYVIELSWVLSWIPCLFWNWKNNWKIPETCRNIQSKAPAVGTGTFAWGSIPLVRSTGFGTRYLAWGQIRAQEPALSIGFGCLKAWYSKPQPAHSHTWVLRPLLYQYFLNVHWGPRPCLYKLRDFKVCSWPSEKVSKIAYSLVKDGSYPGVNNTLLRVKSDHYFGPC